MSTPAPPPRIVSWTLRLENTTGLDRPVRALEPAVNALLGDGALRSVLRGEWLGHSVHPAMTDVALGAWTSATVLDLIGGEQAAPSAQRLVGTGLLTALPTAWTGWAEWSTLGTRDKRVGLVHGLTNGAAIGVYAASYVARVRGRRGSGVRLALAGMAITTLGAYLGGHLTEARKVASRDPAYDESAAPTDLASQPTEESPTLAW